MSLHQSNIRRIAAQGFRKGKRACRKCVEGLLTEKVERMCADYVFPYLLLPVKREPPGYMKVSMANKNNGRPGY